MNFMSGRSGFYEDAAATTRASASSSSSSSYRGGGGGGLTYPHPAPREDDSERGGEGVVQREHMFDKVVTPSDVGKLNRLVIPKQHAEKYFPLDSSTNDKGLLLNFEDRNGKPWRFRYSYWNSSQSYVMTKGWSRFVKEKKLDAGDIVSFQRGVGDSGRDRLFIDWRRRPDAPEPPSTTTLLSLPHQMSFHRSLHVHHPWSTPYYMPPPPNPHFLHQFPLPYSSNIVNGNPCPPGSILYIRGGGGGQQIGGSSTQMVYESVPVVPGQAAAKRLRLFGVNMECPISESDECDILSSTRLAQLPPDSSIQSTLHLRPNDDDAHHKGKTPSMSLDLDI